MTRSTTAKTKTPLILIVALVWLALCVAFVASSANTAASLTLAVVLTLLGVWFLSRTYFAQWQGRVVDHYVKIVSIKDEDGIPSHSHVHFVAVRLDGGRTRHIRLGTEGISDDKLDVPVGTVLKKTRGTFWKIEKSV